MALRWAAAGYQVIIGSRSIDRAQSVAQLITKTAGPNSKVSGMLNDQAAAAAEVVVVTVPFAALMDTLKAVKASLTPSKILVNVTVPLETAIGGKPTRTLGLWGGSAGEMVSNSVPKGISVVTAFNNVSAEPLSDLAKKVECDVLICGDDRDAKKIVMELVTAIPGARGIDAGPLENSRTVEQITALLVGMNIRYGVHSAGFRVTGIPLP